MATNSMDNKFGLPKPDFQGLPKKKVVWPLFLGIVILAILIILIKIGYTFYFRATDQHPPRSFSQAADNGASTDQTTHTNRSSISSSAPARGEQTSTNVNESDRRSVRSGQLFQSKKNTKIKESIRGTKKQLVAKQKKPLVKPGTYQELKDPQGIYHLVVVSYLDKQSAIKTVHQLMKKNLGVCLILPRTEKGEKYYRVTIGHSKTRYEADEKFKECKPLYKNIFILEY